MADEKYLDQHFEFGKNWQKFLRGINDEKLASSIHDIETFLGQEVLTGKSFVDIGCGSGLSSLAAYKLGAREIYSCDIDPVNIDNVSLLKQHVEVPKEFPWHSEVRSIVDPDDVQHISKGDIIYSWGVLHHTGDMWAAIRNTASLVPSGGYLYLMIYRDAKLAYPWKVIKRSYVRAPGLIKFLMRNIFAAVLIAGILAKGKNPLKSIKNYGRKSRGMSWYTDVTDWIGGYPFEYAEAEEVIKFLQPMEFKLKKISPAISPKAWGVFGTGSYQYLFIRS